MAQRSASARTAVVSVLVALVLGAAGYLFYRTLARNDTQTSNPAAAAPKALNERDTVSPPPVKFVDITDSAGIDFVHENGSYGEKLLPETMGSGVAAFDYDRDGDQDLLFVNFAPWLGHERNELPTQRFYRNRGDGTFEDVTAEVGLDVTLYGMGVAVGDCNNDGFPDVVLTGLSGNRLFLNEQGKRFVEKTDSGLTSAFGWSTSAAFLDYDRDGKLDLFICNYVQWTPEIDRAQGFRLTGIGRAFGPPTNFAGTHSQLFRGNGDGTFVDVSESAGVHKFDLLGNPKGKALGVVTCDMDRDGWTDILVANDTVQNFFFHNLGNGTFEEIGEVSGIAFDSAGNTRGAMGIDVAEHRLNGMAAVAIGNFSNEASALYVTQNEARLFFSDEAIGAGLAQPTRLMLTFGVAWFDYDLDCYPDLLSVNGHLEEEIQQVNPSLTYEQPAQLFWNTGGKTLYDFVEVTAEAAGPDLFKPVVGRGLAIADLDNDGDCDVVITSNGGRALVLRNDGGNRNNWLRIVLEGDGQRVNRSAYGTRVVLRTPDGRELVQELAGGRSYLSQCELVLTFGLGKHESVPRVEVHWPDGTVQTLEDVKANQVLRVVYKSQQDSSP